MARSRASKNVRAETAQHKKLDIKGFQISQETIDKHWESFPRQAKQFLLQTNDHLSLFSLLSFWSVPQFVEFTRGQIARSICGTSWYLALVYSKLGKVPEARSLLINGSFFEQCYNTSIEYIETLYENNCAIQIPEDKLPYFCSGFFAVSSQQAMESFLDAKLSAEYQRMMTSFVGLSSRGSTNKYIDQISEDWKSCSSKNNLKRHSESEDEEDQISIIIADEHDENEQYSFNISANTTLKTLFNGYANERGVSLRSLRFSYNGKTIFLSSAGYKTPKELGMHDKDIIVSSPSQPTTIEEKEEVESSTKKNTSKCRAPSKKAKGKRKKKGNNRLKVDKTVVDYKVEHSKYLTLLFEEAAPTFKQIRQDLNVIALECQKPKKKTTAPKQKDSKNTYVLNPSMDGLGGKAGKARFDVLVGEVENLYKTTKPSASSHRLGSNTTCGTTSLDLHGCTREEALEKLDECLVNWNEAAMHGSYPWVIPVNIICGCGNQILSETVEQWIKQTSKVANAPKQPAPRRMCCIPRVA